MNKLKALIASAIGYKFFRSETITRETAVAFSFLIVAIVFICYKQSFNQQYVNGYIFAHLLYDYSEEFIKRGLVGEIFRLFGIGITKSVYNNFANTLLILFTIAAIFLFSRPLKFSAKATGLWLFVALAIAHSGTLQHFAFDRGRFDQINFLLALVACAAIIKVKNPLVYPIVLFLTGIGILVHEMSFITLVPMVFCFWLYVDRAKKLAPKIAIFALLVALAAFTGLNGFVTKKSYEDHLAQVNKAYPKQIPALAIENVHNRIDIFDHTRIAEAKSLKEHAKLFLYLAPFGFLLWQVLRKNGGGGAERRTPSLRRNGRLNSIENGDCCFYF